MMDGWWLNEGVMDGWWLNEGEPTSMLETKVMLLERREKKR